MGKLISRIRGFRKPKTKMALSAKVIAGPETAAKLGVPVGTEIDLGTVSETEGEGWGVKADG